MELRPTPHHCRFELTRAPVVLDLGQESVEAFIGECPPSVDGPEQQDPEKHVAHEMKVRCQMTYHPCPRLTCLRMTIMRAVGFFDTDRLRTPDPQRDAPEQHGLVVMLIIAVHTGQVYLILEVGVHLFALAQCMSSLPCIHEFGDALLICDHLLGVCLGPGSVGIRNLPIDLPAGVESDRKKHGHSAPFICLACRSCQQL